jgi:hypothetical protein
MQILKDILVKGWAYDGSPVVDISERSKMFSAAEGGCRIFRPMPIQMKVIREAWRDFELLVDLFREGSHE